MKWRLVGATLAGILLMGGAALWLEPKARAFAGNIATRVEHKFWNVVDPPQTVAALHDPLFDHTTALVIGAPDAGDRETIVVFIDYNCRACRRQFQEFDSLAEQGQRLRVIVRHSPHSPDSIQLAEAMLAARQQGKAEALHRVLVAAQGRLGSADVPALAAAAGLDPIRLRNDVGSPETHALLDADVRLGWKLRLAGTPTLIVGEQAHRGWRTAAQLASLLDNPTSP